MKTAWLISMPATFLIHNEQQDWSLLTRELDGTSRVECYMIINTKYRPHDQTSLSLIVPMNREYAPTTCVRT